MPCPYRNKDHIHTQKTRSGLEIYGSVKSEKLIAGGKWRVDVSGEKLIVRSDE